MATTKINSLEALLIMDAERSHLSRKERAVIRSAMNELRLLREANAKLKQEVQILAQIADKRAR